MSLQNRSFHQTFRWVMALLALTTAGCAEKQILDETGLVTVIGYDQTEDGLIRGTILVPVINPEADEKIQVASAVGLTSKGIRDKVNLQMDKRVLGGQLRVALYDEKLARKGIISIVDTLYRDPTIASRLYLCVTTEETSKIITFPYKEEGNIGMYLYRMIDQNVHGEKIPSSTIHEFLRSYFSAGSDPFLPLIEPKGDELRIKGLALFHKDKYIGWIDTNEAFLIKLIRDFFEAGSYETSLPRSALGLPNKKNSARRADRFYLVFDTLSSQSKVKVTRKSPPNYEVTIKLSARIYELGEPISLTKEMLAKIEKALEADLEQKLKNMLKKLQKLEVDPIGFGEMYRASTRGARQMKHDEWHNLYKQSTFQWKVKVKLVRSGIME
ncbi:Ger(x)C family spore germination protein [Brevibacillus migulae]|uniref:Ger(x)C family spore germination protein n=1 Tax=Brevibacillus migulae TaxID=1644114 RepID=UPI001F38B941|nr:Ger(x)C family spore germination protein [Brevibacillus migulae]